MCVFCSFSAFLSFFIILLCSYVLSLALWQSFCAFVIGRSCETQRTPSRWTGSYNSSRLQFSHYATQTINSLHPRLALINLCLSYFLGDHFQVKSLKMQVSIPSHFPSINLQRSSFSSICFLGKKNLEDEKTKNWRLLGLRLVFLKISRVRLKVIQCKETRSHSKARKQRDKRD